MTTYEFEEPTPSKRQPILSSQLKHMELLPDDQRFYKISVQVGPYIGGRMPGSGKWLKQASQVVGEPEKLDPEYRVYDRIVNASEANGYITYANEWLVANRRKDTTIAAGLLGNMIAVLHTEELPGYVPKSTTFVNVPVDLLDVVIGRIIDARLANMTKPTSSKT